MSTLFDMPSPVQVPNRTPSPKIGRRRPNLINKLPPVFSPENSPPPMGATLRKQYLPLISPAITEDDRPFNFDARRRGSTPSLTAKSSASHYFEELRKRRRTSESSPAPVPSTTPVFVLQKGSANGNKIAELPTSIAQPILLALEAQAQSTISSNQSFSSLKKRTMSLPSSHRPVDFTELDGGDETANRMAGLERRASVRSHQLALLASQARLARTGASSVDTALRAERAVKGAVKKAVEDAQASKASGLTIKDVVDSAESDVVDKRSSDSTKIKDPIGELQDTTRMWSNALSSPQVASAFLHSASEVAHDWANGFYAFEKEWAGDALQKERRRLSQQEVGLNRKREREDEEEVEDDNRDEKLSQPIQPPSPKRTASEPSTRDVSPMIQSSTLNVSAGSSSARNSLVAAHKQLSTSLPNLPTLSSVREMPREGEGGKLVDVLSNFVDLIEQRKEGCHSLERLAKDARRLSTVQLPSLAAVTTFPPQEGLNKEAGDDEADEVCV